MFIDDHVPSSTPYDGPLGTLIMGQPYDFFPNPTLWFPKIRGTPSHHPFIDGIFRYKQSIWLLGYPIYGNPHIWINPKSIVSDASTQRFWWQAATKSSGKRSASLDTENPHRPTSLWVLAPATADDPFRATSKTKNWALNESQYRNDDDFSNFDWDLPSYWIWDSSSCIDPIL